MATRPPIPGRVQAAVLHAADHTCSVCNNREHDVQIHHINGDPSNNTFENLVVLCINCHSRVTGTRGLGKSYSREEVRLYKQGWEDRVRQQRAVVSSQPAPITKEFLLFPDSFATDTGIDVRFGGYIRGFIDLSNPFHVDTTQRFEWMEEFIDRYRNQGSWIGDIKYFSPSGIETYDDTGIEIRFEYPAVVLDTWAAIYLQVGSVKHRIESLSMKDSLINTPPNNDMKPLLMEETGRLWIRCNRHPYVAGTAGEIRISITRS